jgi:hypothetical protein
MSISGDYPTPVTVNGFSCRNCTDVDYAKKHIDPQHPKSGPYGVDARNDPTLRNDPAAQRSAAVSFGGSLSGLNGAAGPAAPENPEAADPAMPGAQLDILA